ncbi:MAG: hypothetical protein ACR2JC_16600 [Chloroflexota bacterium]
MGKIEKVYFFTHTHTDIGYTHPQDKVAEQQVENIALALEFCREGAEYIVLASAGTESILDRKPR